MLDVAAVSIDKDTRIAVLTYDAPHRKTQDVLFRLRGMGYADVVVVAMPWQERKNHAPLFPHRPDNVLPVKPMLLATRLGYRFQAAPHDVYMWLDTWEPAVTLIGGAGILPDPERRLIVNSHPGYLPNVRGLDALKWAIYDDQPIGVTAHVIDAEADSGWLIDRKIIAPAFTEDFGAFARRQYELEVSMLVASLAKLDAAKALRPLIDHEILKHQPHRRMPHARELEMMAKYRRGVA